MTAPQGTNSIDIENNIDFLVKELIFLLQTSGFDDDTKNIIVDSIEHMEMEEIVDMISQLEAKYINTKTQSLDKSLENRLEAIYEDFTKKQLSTNTHLVDKLEDISKQLD